MRTPGLFLLGLLFALLVACEQNTLPDGMDAETLHTLGLGDDVVFQPGVHYLTPAQSATATIVGDTLTFPAPDNPWLSSVAEGDVLWSPHGHFWEQTFALQVEAVTEEDGHVVFRTREAGLDAVFASASFSTDEQGAASPGDCEIGPASAMNAPARVDAAAADTEGRYPAYRDGKWGFIDRSGSWVIEPRFYQAMPPAEGLAAVQPCASGLWGFIDAQGEPAIEATFPVVDSFSEGLAPVLLEEDVLGMVDRLGKVVLRGQYHALFGFSEGLARAETNHEVAMNRKVGFVDRSGAWVIPPDLHAAGDFAEGLAPAQGERNGRWGYIDAKGDWAIQPRFRRGAGNFSEGLAPVETGVLEWTYIDTTGAVVFDHVFRDAQSFAEGLALVRGDAEPGWYYIDKHGEPAITEADGRWFCQALPFRQGLAQVHLVREGDECSGAHRVDNRFVWQNATMAYIDKSGTIVYEQP